MARRAADAVRRRRRLRHVRLLHRGRQRQGEGEPRRLHRRARTTTCWCRAWRATRTPSATSATPTTTENKDKLKAVPIDERRRTSRSVPSHRERSTTAPTSRCRARCSSTCSEVARSGPRSRSSWSSTSARAPTLVERSRLRAAADRRLQAGAGARSGQQAGHGVRRHAGSGRHRSTRCWRAKQALSRLTIAAAQLAASQIPRSGWPERRALRAGGNCRLASISAQRDVALRTLTNEMTSPSSTPAISRCALRYRKVRDRIVEALLLAAGLVAVFTTAGDRADPAVESCAFFDARLDRRSS